MGTDVSGYIGLYRKSEILSKTVSFSLEEGGKVIC